MFVRIKKISGHDYAYLVRNRWTKNGPRQKSRKYLGKVVRLEKVRECSLLDLLEHKDIDFFIENNDLKDIVRKLVEVELLRHGFERDGKLYRKEDFVVDVINLGFLHKGKNVVFSMNEGLMCGKSIEKLIGFEIRQGEEATGLALAEAFVNSGINVEKDVFVKVFQKVF